MNEPRESERIRFHQPARPFEGRGGGSHGSAGSVGARQWRQLYRPRPAAEAEYAPKVFNAHQWKTLQVLSDLILPADGQQRERHGRQACRNLSMIG